MNEVLSLKRKSLESHIKETFPDFEFINKKESTLMKWLSKLLFFNKRFMTSFITVIGNKMYVPMLPWKENNPYGACEVLAHEFVHMKDNQRLGPLFKFLYLCPQILMLLSVFAFWNPWWFLCLGFLLPIPAPFRAHFEFKAYVVSMAVQWWLLSKKANPEFFVNQFVSANYYWMFPFKRILNKKFEEEFTRIKDGNLKPYEQEIKKALKV